MMEKKLEPNFRFSEYEKSWKTFKLGNIASFSKGKGISKKDISIDGVNSCIRYGELYTTYGEIINDISSKTNVSLKDSVLSDENDVIIPSSGETQIDIATASCVTKKGIILGGDLNIIKSKLNGIFLSYLLNNKKKTDIAKLAQGNSVVHIYSKHLASLKVNIPNLAEQQKIATFLSSVDKRIEQLHKKKALLEDYKKGMMQKIFSQEVRFKSSNGNDFEKWKQKKLGDLVKKAKSGGTPRSTNKDYYNGSIPFLAISDMTEQGKYLKYTTKSISQQGLDISSSWLVPKNSIIYSMYASVGFVSINKIELATSQAVMNLIFKTNINIEYIYYFLYDYKSKIHRLIETGTQGNINASIVKNLKIELPSLEEQHKIAEFLSAIDKKIELVQTQIDRTTAFKKGLLQQMFV